MRQPSASPTPSRPVPVCATPDRLALLVYTSGATGRPTAVMLALATGSAARAPRRDLVPVSMMRGSPTASVPAETSKGRRVDQP
ncbi:MAG: hypothetical protein E6F99_01580 [Actinobacteria bacterium]|nr:MAG: hypothetical protein E6F99_01580 [Actinomycetota bacterium]